MKQARLADSAARLPGAEDRQPDDIANAVSYLMSDSLVTGTVLHAEVDNCWYDHTSPGLGQASTRP